MAIRSTRKYLAVECVKLGGSDKMPVSRDGHFLRDVTRTARFKAQICAVQSPNLRGSKSKSARVKAQIRAGQSPNPRGSEPDGEQFAFA
jgi:hypothetical protein